MQSAVWWQKGWEPLVWIKCSFRVERIGSDIRSSETTPISPGPRVQKILRSYLQKKKLTRKLHKITVRNDKHWENITLTRRERGRKKDIQINNLPQVPVVPGSHYRRHTCVSAALWRQSCGQSSQYPPERRTPVLNRTRWTSASLEYPWLSTLLWVESPLPACGVEPLRTLWTDGWFIILCGNVINDFVIITCSTWMTLNKKKSF